MGKADCPNLDMHFTVAIHHAPCYSASVLSLDIERGSGVRLLRHWEIDFRTEMVKALKAKQIVSFYNLTILPPNRLLIHYFQGLII